MWCSTSDPERARRELVRAWLTKAEEDLRAAEAILAAPMPSYGTASFHAQQGAEKALKALLARHGVQVEKTHDLGRLLRQAENVSKGIALRLADADALTPFAVLTRYPMSTPPTERARATEHLALARPVFEVVAERLRDYLAGAASAT